jgi:eukaryotic-like serine/threonine-protein kinase
LTLPLPAAPYRAPRISPDGKKVAYETEDGVIWVYGVSGGAAPLRLTFDGLNYSSNWTPDGRYVIFQHPVQDEQSSGLYRQLADGTGPAEPLTKPERGVRYVPWSVDPSGTVMAVLATKGSGGPISFLALNGGSRVQAIEGNGRQASFSRDGRWVAYEERAGERSQIFVRPYPDLSARYQITEDGNFPVWSPDSKQVFYIRAPNKFFVVDIQTEPSFTFGKPSELPIAGTLHDVNGPRNYDITPDGKQFVVVMPASQAETSQPSTQISVVLNWFEELKQPRAGAIGPYVLT